jgi:hypothetical protein
VNRAGIRFDEMNLEDAFGQVDGDGRGFHLDSRYRVCIRKPHAGTVPAPGRICVRQ